LGKGIDRIVLYGEKPKNTHNGRVTSWEEFLSLGKEAKNESELQLRMGRMQPGNCATLIYTSGTTGMPKGVMLSHDNFLFSVKTSNSLDKISQQAMRIISYLPLSHAAGQFIDIFVALLSGHHVYFADPSALTGSLIDTLL
jgi:long-chain-fatty-acid--CoA ligase ACSBG